ncbi:MAG TPA: nitrous oxide reductase family maturation protein NosD [Thiotrichales bacterium]|nr:nitrous oxide reductase family maturation protein NosD [Thiotrichales bacterium]
MIFPNTAGLAGRVLLAWLLAATANAAVIQARPEGQPLQALLESAAPGDHIRLAPGVYRVNLVIDRALELSGEEGAVLDGGGEGDVIRVRSPGVVIRNLVIRRSGRNLTAMNAGIFVERQAKGVLIHDNVFEDNLFGIWLDACREPRIIGNRIHGNPAIRSQDRGNGVHLYAVHGGLVRGNEIWETRDGIYIDTSVDNRLEDNFLHDLRYGVHYMYSHRNRVTGNRTLRTRTGFALMQSRELTVVGNRSEHDLNYGILMNYITYSTIADNRVVGTRRGQAYVTGGAGVAGAEGKALFIYNSQFNEIRGNVLEGADIGIHLTAGSEDNRIHGNAFIGNRTQVKYVATRPQEWSQEGRGNYWSDYLGWDLDADGIGDRPYEPNDAVDKLLWRYPMVRVLMNSPAVETLRWVQSQFPVLKPQGVRDSYPLMRPPGREGTL